MSRFDIRDIVGTNDSKSETPAPSLKNLKKREVVEAFSPYLDLDRFA